MKAFQHIAALGLGAVATLGETTRPVAAQTKTIDTTAVQAEIEASAQITGSAIALIPNLQAAIALEQVPPEPSIALEVIEAPDVQVEKAVVSSAAAPEVAASPVVKTEFLLDLVPAITSPAVLEIVQAEVETPEADNSSVPVDSGNVDPVEVEFEQEGNAATTDAAQPDGTEAAPTDGLSDATSETASEAETMVLEEGVVTDSNAPATTLVDQQPNLFRPDESEEVSIEVNEAISLETAIEIARQNNPGITVRQLQLEQSMAAVDEARAAYAPQFSVNGSFDNSGTFTDTDELYREPDFGQDNDSTARDATVSLSGNARIDYGIIDPDRKARVNAAKIAADQAKLTLEQELAELRLTVSQAYYQLQNADEQVKISEQAVISAQRSLKDAEALEKAGVGTRFSVLQADVQLANEQQNLVNNLSAQQQSRRQLAQVLSTPEKLNLTASDPVASAGTWTMTLETSLVKAYQNRVELDNQLLQRDLSDAQRQIALSATRPSLTAFAQAGPGLRWDFNRTDPEGSGDDTTSGFHRGTLGYQAGLRFQWLFGDGGATKAAARQQALNKAIAEENFEAARDQVRREVEDAFYDLAANLRNIDTSEQGVIQADEALRLARLRFQAGVGTQSEVVDAERDLTTARGNRVTAILNYNRALVQIQRAIGETLEAPELKIPAYVDGEG